jgi:hypothetical protein
MTRRYSLACATARMLCQPAARSGTRSSTLYDAQTGPSRAVGTDRKGNWNHMETWFVRSNGETGHNNPASKLYVRGEPPTFPERHFNYKQECIEGEFARIGWPAAGDLRRSDWRVRARNAYAPGPSELHLSYLQQFSKIRVGDLVLIPADREKFNVRLGLVQPNPCTDAAPNVEYPYYYHYDIASGDWYENAHRVPVLWLQHLVSVPALGGLWRKAFGRVAQGRSEIVRLAKQAGLVFGSVQQRLYQTIESTMSTRRSREEILQVFRALRARLGRTPSKAALEKHGRIKESEIQYYWPRPNDLAIEAGAPPNSMQVAVADDDVFLDYARVCLHYGRIPTTAELRIATRDLKTRTHTVAKRYGTMRGFDSEFKSWLEDQPDAQVRTILSFPGWDRAGGKLGPPRSAPAKAHAVPPLRPFLPTGLLSLDPLSRGERAEFEDPGAPVSLLFERRVADAFRCLGFEVKQFGQGTGRKADSLAIDRADGFAVIIDAKARQGTYTLGTEDRKFFEYANTHAGELQAEGIGRVYFVIVAGTFRDSDVGKLQSTLTASPIRSIAFLTVSALLNRVEESIRDRHLFSLRDLEKELFANSHISA